jgi:hypothetical protein
MVLFCYKHSFSLWTLFLFMNIVQKDDSKYGLFVVWTPFIKKNYVHKQKKQLCIFYTTIQIKIYKVYIFRTHKKKLCFFIFMNFVHKEVGCLYELWILFVVFMNFVHKEEHCSSTKRPRFLFFINIVYKEQEIHSS